MKIGNFDIDILATHVKQKLAALAQDHPEDVFYGFAIDADQFRLNSLEGLAATVSQYKTLATFADTDEDTLTEQLRDSVGDWSFGGDLLSEEGEGFDHGAYFDHDEMSDEEQMTSDYGRAMDALVARLVADDAFAVLKTSDSFTAKRVEHVY